jgi:hypothetical protein
MVDAPVENIIMYIPEAEATLGGHTILSNKGLNIAPPPRPRAPETQPPMNEKAISLPIVFPSNLISV